MIVEWDEAKRKVNLRKHALDFADATQVLSGVTLTIEDTRYDYGEQRFIALGLLRNTVVVLAYTERSRRIRVISMRKALKHEAEHYFKAVGY